MAQKKSFLEKIIEIGEKARNSPRSSWNLGSFFLASIQICLLGTGAVIAGFIFYFILNLIVLAYKSLESGIFN